MAEQSVEMRKEKESLALLKEKRNQLEQKLRLKKLVKESLIQNMDGAAEVSRMQYHNYHCAMSCIKDIVKLRLHDCRLEYLSTASASSRF